MNTTENNTPQDDFLDIPDHFLWQITALAYVSGKTRQQALTAALAAAFPHPKEAPGPGTLPCYLTEDLREARRSIFLARLDGRPLGHDYRENPAKSSRPAADTDSEPATDHLDEAEEMGSDLWEAERIFG